MQKKASAPSVVSYDHFESDSASAVPSHAVQKVFFSHPAIVLLVDHNQKCLWWNHAADAVLGSQFPEREVFLKDVIFGVGDCCKEVEKGRNCEVLFISVAGGLIMTEAMLSEVMIEEYGKCTLIIATNKSQERTRHSRRENTSMQTEEFETIVSLSPVTAVRFSVQNDLFPNYISDSIKQFGYTPRDFYTGKRCFWSILHHEDIGFVKSAVRDSLKRMVPNLTLSFRVMTAMGQIRNIEGFFHLRDYHTSSLREFQCVLIDTTGMDAGSEAVAFSDYLMQRKFSIKLVD